jgi:predicted RNA-binding protein YlqC (UPF0109 family)
MEQLAADLASLVYASVKPLVDFPDELEVISTADEQTGILVEIHTNPEDAGKVIGRQGRIIKAVRTLARACASKTDVSVDVELVD